MHIFVTANAEIVSHNDKWFIYSNYSDFVILFRTVRGRLLMMHKVMDIKLLVMHIMHINTK